MKRFAAVLTVGFTVIAASVAFAASGTLVKTATSSAGTFLVSANGHALYAFSSDTPHKSACSGSCATSWIPIKTVGKPRAGGKAKASDLSTISRSGGVKQVTYKGHPLYGYVGDTGAGQTNGQGQYAFGGYWYLVSAGGKTITNATQTTSSSSSW